MALYFKEFTYPDGSTRWGREWHVGEPLPPAAGRRVITIQADGDEAEVILAALGNKISPKK